MKIKLIGLITFLIIMIKRIQNYPNPFNPSTTIKYNLPEIGNVKLSVYNSIGKEVAVLVNGIVEVGFYDLVFNASSLPIGIYFYKLQTGNSTKMKKMLLMKQESF